MSRRYKEMQRYYADHIQKLNSCLAYSQRIAMSVYFLESDGAVRRTELERLDAINAIASALGRRTKLPEEQLFRAAENALESALEELEFRRELSRGGYSQLALLPVQLAVLEMLVKAGFKRLKELQQAVKSGAVMKIRGINKARVRMIRRALEPSRKPPKARLEAAGQKTLF